MAPRAAHLPRLAPLLSASWLRPLPAGLLAFLANVEEEESWKAPTRQQFYQFIPGMSAFPQSGSCSKKIRGEPL